MNNKFEGTPKGLFRDRNHYMAFVAAAKRAARKKKFTAEHHIIYAAFRNRDWSKGFTSATNAKKIMNGRHSGDTLNRIQNRMQSTINMGIHNPLLIIFGGTITSEMFDRMFTMRLVLLSVKEAA